MSSGFVTETELEEKKLKRQVAQNNAKARTKVVYKNLSQGFKMLAFLQSFVKFYF